MTPIDEEIEGIEFLNKRENTELVFVFFFKNWTVGVGSEKEWRLKFKPDNTEQVVFIVGSCQFSIACKQ